MTEGQTFAPAWFSKPGDALRAMMVRRDLSADQLARYLPGGLATLRGLLDGSAAIDRSLATVLTKQVGGTAKFWLQRQANYQTALERAVDRAQTIEAQDWLLLPVPGEKPRGRLSPSRQRDEIRRRLAFFNVDSIVAWEARYGRLCSDTLFRTSQAVTTNDRAVLMWLRSGELGADLVSTRSWNAGNLRDRLDAIRKLTNLRHPESFLPKLKELCAEAGVAVVAKRAPKGCPASGASRMVAPDKAMILLSFRGLSDDKFWFTVFHEIGHLVLHGAKTFVDWDMDELDDSEREANEFASDCIIPGDRLEEFAHLAPAKNPVIRYSVRVGVSPGLIVGQMQHRKMIELQELNYLKRRWTWDGLAQFMD